MECAREYVADRWLAMAASASCIDAPAPFVLPGGD